MDSPEGIRTLDVLVKTICLDHLTTGPMYKLLNTFFHEKPSASIALTSTDYKTVALLLC